MFSRNHSGCQPAGATATHYYYFGNSVSHIPTSIPQVRIYNQRSQTLCVKPAQDISVGTKSLRNCLILVQRERGKHPSRGGSMLETASREPATYDHIIRETINYRTAIRGHGVHAGFANRGFPVIQQRQAIPNVAGNFGDILLNGNHVAAFRISLWSTVIKHLDEARVFIRRQSIYACQSCIEENREAAGGAVAIGRITPVGDG